MKQVIKDITIKACVCGKDKKSVIERAAKRRVMTWFGVTILALFTLAIALGGFVWSDWDDFGGVIGLFILLYIIIGIPAKFIHYHNKKHALFCSLRHAFYDVV